MKYKFIHNNKGDTIVEVLICIIIMSLIVTGAYITSNSSLAEIFSAQQRQQVLGVAQSQLETLRAEATTIPKGYYGHTYPGAAFCFINAVFTDFGSGAPCLQNGITSEITALRETDSGNNITTYVFRIHELYQGSSVHSTSGDTLDLFYKVSIQ
jgi:type II secretory pathway pseudopilin PulG